MIGNPKSILINMRLKMKKVLVLIMIISVVLLFCACNNTSNATTPNDIAEPTSDATTNPQENVTIDWETPIYIDDSFLEETSSSEGAAEVTEPEISDPTEPTENTSQKPTQGTDPTESTEPVISSPTNGSGAIELPMIPG